MAKYRLMAQLVTTNRVLDGERALEPGDPQARAFDVELTAAHADGLADAQAVPVDHQEQGIVADAVPAFLGRLKQASDLRLAEEILRALVGIGRSSVTLYNSPFGRHRGAPRKRPYCLASA